MRKLFLFLLTFLFLQSCKGQNIIVDLEKNKDILFFGFNNENVNLVNPTKKNYSLDTKKYWETNPKLNTEIYNKNKSIIFSQKKTGYGSTYLDKEYSFIQNKDTMSIKCKCGQAVNYFLINIKFQKGKFELNLDFPRKFNEQTKKYESQINYILGNQIKTSKEVQNILFKNSYMWWESKGEFKDFYFKDLKFIEIDLKDTINNKLKKLD